MIYSIPCGEKGREVKERWKRRRRRMRKWTKALSAPKFEAQASAFSS
jgi:hypothetical protein